MVEPGLEARRVQLAAVARFGQLGANESEEAFRAALRRAPARGWALYGLMEAAKARGDSAAAQEVEARLPKAWVGDANLLDLKRV